jgi:hypothetical protein
VQHRRLRTRTGQRLRGPATAASGARINGGQYPPRSGRQRRRRLRRAAPPAGRGGGCPEQRPRQRWLARQQSRRHPPLRTWHRQRRQRNRPRPPRGPNGSGGSAPATAEATPGGSGLDTATTAGNRPRSPRPPRLGLRGPATATAITKWYGLPGEDGRKPQAARGETRWLMSLRGAPGEARQLCRERRRLCPPATARTSWLRTK